MITGKLINLIIQLSNDIFFTSLLIPDVGMILSSRGCVSCIRFLDVKVYRYLVLQ